MVLEYCPNGDLKKLLDRQGEDKRLNNKDALKYAKQLVDVIKCINSILM